MSTLRLMVMVAHPDDEALGFGGVLARYSSRGVDTFVVTCTKGDRGRFNGHAADSEEHPGPAALARIREQELLASAEVLGVRETVLLDYGDQVLDRVPVGEIVPRLAALIRRVRPDVVLTFPPDGAYGHPDHVAISQFATAAIVEAANPVAGRSDAHRVGKLYYIAWSEAAWGAYQAAFKRLVSIVDGVQRQAVPWPDWAITTVVDTRPWWNTVWRAVSCHASQVSGYAALTSLAPEHHEALWGSQTFYRVYSLVNGGRVREHDLFEGFERGARVPRQMESAR